MKLIHRAYDDERHDFEKLWHFIRQDYADKQDDFIWLFSRLGDWKHGLWGDKKCVPGFFSSHAHLWVDGFDEPQGFVLSEDGGEIFFIFTRRGYGWLYADILDWTLANWAERYPSLKTEVHEHQLDALRLLAARGFASQGVAATTRTYDLIHRDDGDISLPPGYRMVTMQENQDFYNKALLYADGFNGKSNVDEQTLLKLEYSRQSPAYDPALDYSVVTDAGVHAATCVGFYDPAHSVAEVEKVCTHSQHRRLGLAEAVIKTCFQQLKVRGIKTAYITGYSGEANGLYEKLNPVARRQWYHYEKTNERSKKVRT